MRTRQIFGLTGGIIFLEVVAGCSTTNPQLEQLRADYAKASSDSQISSNAPVALDEAERALARAEKAWKENGDDDEVDHLAYLADRRLSIARARAQYAAAQQDIKQLSDERDKVLLEARKREADQATQRAVAQKKAADIALAEAARARAQAEEERRQALARSKEAELAREQARHAKDEARQTASQAKELERQLASLAAKVKQTPRGLVLTLGDVLFEFDKADLKAGAVRNLHPLVDFLKKYDERKVVIEGHTDAIGTDNYNLELSRRRANAIRNFLVQNDIKPERITARGLGESYPVASNDTEAGRQQNRRVEIEIAQTPTPVTGANRQ